jgi:hypothetical protein
MNFPQELLKQAPRFGSPDALRRQTQELAAQFTRTLTPPDDATEILSTFWQIYRTEPNRLKEALTTDQLDKLTWCFPLEWEGSRILDDPEATEELLSLIQHKYQPDFLHGLRYSFCHAYQQGDDGFEMLKSTFHHLLNQLDPNRADAWRWQVFAEILPETSHTALAKKVLDEDIAFHDIAQQFNLPTDSEFYISTCHAVVDAMISMQLVGRNTLSLLDFLAVHGNLDTIKYAVGKLLLHFKETGYEPGIVNELSDFVLQHLGDIRSDNNLHRIGMDAQARRFFIRWLALTDLQLFFDQISPDGERRRFWREYSNNIEYSRVVINPAHPKASDESIQRLLGQGRAAQLLDDDVEQNALLLKVGDLLIVELGSPRNCRYVYHGQSPPFSLTAETYQTAELCDHVKALFRQDLKKGWQMVLTGMLQGQFGIDRYQSRRIPPSQNGRQRGKYAIPFKPLI